jgi:hypothetical protein
MIQKTSDPYVEATMGYLEYAKGVAQAAYAWSSEGVV